MTKSKVATLVVVVMVLVLPALSAAAGQTTVTSVYTVDGKISGFNTGLVLTDGMSVTATATGVVCAYLNNFCTSPSGDVSYGTTSSLFGGFVLPGAPAFGLVGRVGNGPMGAGRDRADNPVRNGSAGVLGQRLLLHLLGQLREFFGDRDPALSPCAFQAGVAGAAKQSACRAPGSPRLLLSGQRVWRPQPFACRATRPHRQSERRRRRAGRPGPTTEASRAGTLRPTATASDGLPATSS